MGAKMKNKGSVDDIFMLVVMGFILASTFIIGYLMISKVNTAFQEEDSIPTVAKEIMSTNTNRYVALFDGIFMVIFVLLSVGSILLASQIDTNPAFMPISIFLYVALIIVSAVFGNSYYDISQAIEGASSFTIIPFIMNHLVQIMLGLGFILGLVMYARSQ